MAIKKQLSFKQAAIKYFIQSPLSKLISITSKVKGDIFFDLKQFPWTAELENNFEKILHESIKVMKSERLPNIQDVLSQEKPIAKEENWKVYFIYFFWNLVKEHSIACPETTEIIKKIPGLVSAFFSVLAPGKNIPEHYGPYNGVLRCHLGLIIPAQKNCAGLQVGDQVKYWSPGKVLIFDDTNPHSAWNNSTNEYRVVLFIDFLRPLPYLVQIMNKSFLRFLSTDKDLQEGLEYLKHQQLSLVRTNF